MTLGRIMKRRRRGIDGRLIFRSKPGMIMQSCGKTFPSVVAVKYETAPATKLKDLNDKKMKK